MRLLHKMLVKSHQREGPVFSLPDAVGTTTCSSPHGSAPTINASGSCVGPDQQIHRRTRTRCYPSSRSTWP